MGTPVRFVALAITSTTQQIDGIDGIESTDNGTQLDMIDNGNAWCPVPVLVRWPWLVRHGS